MRAFGIFIVFGLLSAVLGDVAFVFVCQKHETSLANCRDRSEKLQEKNFHVILSTDFDLDGDWTIFPLIELVNEELMKIPKWIMFCTEHTVVNVEKLMKLVESLDAESDVFVGRGLTDPGPVIIHHFSSNLDFRFPLLSAGFLLSSSLVRKLGVKLKENSLQNDMDFSIDASYELAQFISHLGCELTHFDQFCIEKGPTCVTHVSLKNTAKLKFAVKRTQIFFAVKTCKKFHNNRLPIVETTWGKETERLKYYSDSYNEDIPTVVLNAANTDHGHCAKTQEIISDLLKILKAEKTLKWVVISDDDTILSVSRIVDLVRDYNSSHPVALGERYGYNLLKDGGYNYLTGGGGVILSRAAVKKFKKNSCTCPSATTPDDMFLFGVCFKRLGIQLIHIPTMHQARPNDYSPDYLAIGNPITFHKHWMIDPKRVYQKWFAPLHDEL